RRNHRDHRLHPQHARLQRRERGAWRCRSRAGRLRGKGAVFDLPSSGRQRIAHGTRSERRREFPICRRPSAVARRSGQHDDADQSTRAHLDEGRQDDHRPASERGHVHGPTHRRSGAHALAVENRFSRIHHLEDLPGAVLQGHAERTGDVRSRRVPRHSQRQMIMSRRLLLVLLLVSAVPFALEAQVTYDRLLRAAQEPQNWMTYSGGYASLRHSLLRQIDTSNAKNLEQKWVFQVDSSLQNFEATPLVVDGIMYFTQPINDVVALDAKTG